MAVRGSPEVRAEMRIGHVNNTRFWPSFGTKNTFIAMNTPITTKTSAINGVTLGT